MGKYKLLLLDEIFNRRVYKGDIHESNILDPGNTPLIGCGFENNGVEGYFDIDDATVYKNAISITCDGHPLTAYYHTYEFATKDNVVVCIPPENMSINVIYYILYVINSERWRFSYGRKCYYKKMKKLRFPFPVNNKDDLDTAYIENMIKVDFNTILPTKNVIKCEMENPLFKEFIIGTDLEETTPGDYHSTEELDPGKTPLISCGDTENGLVGYFDIPEDTLYRNTFTIAYNGKPLTTKFHLVPFGAKDDVAVFKNSKNFSVQTLLFIGAMLNLQRWRFSYGRKCYNKKLKMQKILLPADEEGNINEDYIKKLVSKSPYWKYFNNYIL